MTRKQIAAIINTKELDIRRRGPLPKPFDQKTTIDVIATVSRAILAEEASTFTNSKIINSEALKNEIADIYGKPSPSEPTTENEYDKFVGQVTNMLDFAGIISKDGSNFSIRQRHLLEFIASAWQNTYEFLITLIKETLTQSGLLEHFMEYLNKENKTKADYVILRDHFEWFMIEYTNINGQLEPRRIIGKILNPLAYENKTKGSAHGGPSQERILFRELFYSQETNSRDLLKKKSESRAQFIERTEADKFVRRQQHVMKKYMKEIYDNKSALSGEQGLQVHHILMKSDFSEFQAEPENLIPITAQEHTQNAHPNGNYGVIDPIVQKELLLIQRKTILENPDKLNINTFNKMLKAQGIIL